MDQRLDILHIYSFQMFLPYKKSWCGMCCLQQPHGISVQMTKVFRHLHLQEATPRIYKIFLHMLTFSKI